jgi:hypothetical protein
LAVVRIVYVATNTIFFQAIALLNLSLKLVLLAGDLVKIVVGQISPLFLDLTL